MNTQYGRSDRVRTCGLNIPNVARYQLRHTPKTKINITANNNTCQKIVETYQTKTSAGLYTTRSFVL